MVTKMADTEVATRDGNATPEVTDQEIEDNASKKLSQKDSDSTASGCSESVKLIEWNENEKLSTEGTNHSREIKPDASDPESCNETLTPEGTNMLKLLQESNAIKPTADGTNTSCDRDSTKQGPEGSAKRSREDNAIQQPKEDSVTNKISSEANLTNSPTPESRQTDNPTQEGSQTNSTTPESSQTDGPTAESSQTDGPTSESSQTDSSTQETSQTDGPTPESSQTDGPTPDSSQTDTTTPNSSQTDTTTPDSSQTDTTTPESSQTDGPTAESSQTDGPTSKDSSNRKLTAEGVGIDDEKGAGIEIEQLSPEESSNEKPIAEDLDIDNTTEAGIVREQPTLEDKNNEISTLEGIEIKQPTTEDSSNVKPAAADLGIDDATEMGNGTEQPTPDDSGNEKMTVESLDTEQPTPDGKNNENRTAEDVKIDGEEETDIEPTPEGNAIEKSTPENNDTPESNVVGNQAPAGSVTEKVILEGSDAEQTTPQSAQSSDTEELEDGVIQTSVAPVKMILDCLDGFANPLMQGDEDNSNPVYWEDDTLVSRDELQMYSRFWEEQFLTDLTLLVGPRQVRIKVHKLVLAAHFEYFRTMFTSQYVESISSEVHLLFIGPEDLKLILRYAYYGEVNLTKENIFKMAVLASYFGCENLMGRCCDFITNFIDLENCVKLVEMAFFLDISKLQQYCVDFIIDHLSEVNKGDLSALPFELMCEIIQHPAAVIRNGESALNEEALFYLVWNKVKSLPEEEKVKHVTKLLKAIHLPLTGKYFLFFLLREVGHIPEARDLIMKAGEEIDPTETREWYLVRTQAEAWVNMIECYKPIDVNGTTTYEYSECILIDGFPFFVYATGSVREKHYHVESPVAIEHLGLPYTVIVLLKLGAMWIIVNIYQNGVVDRHPVRKQGPLVRDWVAIRLQYESHQSQETLDIINPCSTQIFKSRKSEI